MKSEKDYRELSVQLQECGLKYREGGIHVSYHNDQHEMEQFDGKAILDMIYESTTAEALHAEFDTFWVQYDWDERCTVARANFIC